MRMILCILALLATFAISGTIAPPQASATVMDYHEFVQSYGDTIVQYDFDGSTDSERREDKKGSNDLLQQIDSSYGIAGFDSSSEAVDGAFLTTSAIGLPETVSFDAIIKPEATTVPTYVVASYNDSDRSYFGVLRPADLVAIAGDSYGNEALITDSWNVNDWYYYAVTMSVSYNSEEAQYETTMNTYVANLSDGETTLTPTSTDVVKSGTFQTTLAHGIGANNNQGDAKSPFAGAMDEITFYSGVKDQDFFQANLDRITMVPEPSSWLLALLALLGFGSTTRNYWTSRA